MNTIGILALNNDEFCNNSVGTLNKFREALVVKFLEKFKKTRVNGNKCLENHKSWIIFGKLVFYEIH